MFLVDRDKYSLNDALCDDNDIYKYEESPTNIFFTIMKHAQTPVRYRKNGT